MHQNTKNKSVGEVVEFHNDWQQVGGLLGSVIGNLQLQTKNKRQAQQSAQRCADVSEETLDLFAPRRAA